MKKRFKTILTGLCLTLLSLILAIVMLEIAYRYQWIDFYSAELKQLNKAEDLTCTKKKILVFGDSFSAQQGSYVELLRDSLKDYAIINCAVSGTSMREMSLIAKRRIDDFRPEKLILQLYTGNDLTDISHPYNWQDVSLLRNLYWYASDNCYSLAWLNYRLAPLRKLFDREQAFVSPKTTDTFSVEGYAGRVKLLIKADNNYLEKSVVLNDEKYKKSYNETLKYISVIGNYLKQKNESGKIYVMVVPHCWQVTSGYRMNYEKLGARFTSHGDYPSWAFLMAIIVKHARPFNVKEALRIAEENNIQTYFYNDEHLTPQGQKVVYKRVLEEMK